ncbi:NAC domain-containing protein 37-like isoform X2 [Dioscorea cayenensis subsp. rotundata]|nr:NAC domain-containing protein 37-like isoform X2 [Dioscorea cayenensis subsp. rotundata]XP_039121472.1 NAC domain-containing protein 37-like isoform X2 [Dioscorea cayenensis subsp. rotundata]XP_039121473.1 NAC domain-containing protein 37-like isoform X2 [Dioscorea cayenensis subsp. rotundata]
MDSMESCVPPGFRFHPTDEELVGYYLKKKVASQKIDLDVIKDIDLYRIEPWDLQERCGIGYEEQSEWYFFSHKDKKYPTGTRTNRATMAGFWKATGRDKAVHEKNRLIGMRKTLVFYKGRAPNGQKTDWIMHEYRLETDENGPPQEEGWVVCRAFKKRTTIQTRSIADAWDSSYCYDDIGRLNSINDPIEYLQRQPKSLLCKREADNIENLNLLHSNQFVQLPQLESPSMPLSVKHHSLLSVASENEDDEQARGSNGIEKVTDWRALDKFVASQLSHDEDKNDAEQTPDFGMDKHSDMALFLLENGMEDGSKLNEFFSSSSECDFGICIFEK